MANSSKEKKHCSVNLWTGVWNTEVSCDVIRERAESVEVRGLESFKYSVVR